MVTNKGSALWIAHKFQELTKERRNELAKMIEKELDRLEKNTIETVEAGYAD